MGLGDRDSWNNCKIISDLKVQVAEDVGAIWQPCLGLDGELVGEWRIKWKRNCNMTSKLLKQKQHSKELL